MRRRRFRFTIRFLMFAIAVTAIPFTALVSYREHLKKVERCRFILSIAPSVGGRNHFSSAQGWRDFLRDLRRAEEYLGIPQRPDQTAETWTDEDELCWRGRGLRIIPEPDDRAR